MLALIAALAAIIYAIRGFRAFTLWRWRRTRLLEDLKAEPDAPTVVTAPSIETDLLIQSVMPLCHKIWKAAQNHNVDGLRSQLSEQLAQRLEGEPGPLASDSPIVSLNVISISGDSDAIREFQATVTTESGATQRWTFVRQASGWLVEDIAA